MRRLLVIIPLVALLAAAAWFAFHSWTAIEGPPLPDSLAAIWLGIVFFVAVGCGLMALVIYASRYGYHEAERVCSIGRDAEGHD